MGSVIARWRASAFAILCATVLGGCQSLDDMLKAMPQPTARVTGASLRGLTLEKVELVFDVEVANPYAVSLPLLNLSYAIGSGGQKLFEGGVKPSGAIPARGAKVIQLPAAIGFAPLMGILKGVRPGSVVPYTAALTVGVDAPAIGALNIPLSHSGELPVPAVPEVSLVSFDIGALNLDKVEATAKLRVKNTNRFDLDLLQLGVNLALGGEQVGRTNLANAAKLAPGQAGIVAVPLSFSPRAMGAGFINLLRGSEAVYAVSGTLEAGTRFGAITLPFSQKGNTSISR